MQLCLSLNCFGYRFDIRQQITTLFVFTVYFDKNKAKQLKSNNYNSNKQK